MADLTGILKTPCSVTERIEAWYVANNEPRARLGLSGIGHPCKRCLWYQYHGHVGKQPEGRVLRLFKLGHDLEGRIKADLRGAGYTVTREQELVSFHLDDTILYGHIDGVIAGLHESHKLHLLEIKTAGSKQFAALQRAGSYEQWQPKYKAQVHAYMLGIGLDRALAVVYCKNDSSLYCERIRLDKDYIVRLLAEVFAAIVQEEPPERKCPRADWYEAKWCNHREECWR